MNDGSNIGSPLNKTRKKTQCTTYYN